jgi:hypothetical protein
MGYCHMRETPFMPHETDDANQRDATTGIGGVAEEIYQDLAAEWLRAVVETLIASGHINPAGMTDTEILQQTLRIAVDDKSFGCGSPGGCLVGR